MTKEDLKEKLFVLLKRRSDLTTTLIQLQIQSDNWHKVVSGRADPLREEIKWLNKEIYELSQLLETN